MQGKRKELNEEGTLILDKGEFGQYDGVWYARTPDGHTSCLKRHEVKEHEDGMITVTPSILVNDGRTEWHGYLEAGVWRKI